LESEVERCRLDCAVLSKQVEQLNRDRINFDKVLQSNKKSWDSNDQRIEDLTLENRSLHENVNKLMLEINTLNEEKRNIQSHADSLQDMLNASIQNNKKLESATSKDK